jgi:TonB family protein
MVRSRECLPLKQGEFWALAAKSFWTGVQLWFMALTNPMKRALSFICAAICTLVINGCETAPEGPVNNKVTFSGEYITIGQADVKPRARFQTPVPYPLSMREAGITGKVIIDFLVEPDGHTSQVQIQFATNQTFGEAAKEAIEQWIFTPGMRNGVPARVALEEPISFNLSYAK